MRRGRLTKIILTAFVFALIALLPIASQFTYLHYFENDASCSIAGSGQAAKVPAVCGVSPTSNYQTKTVGSSPNTSYELIYDFRENQSLARTFFTFEFSANQSLTVVLNDESSGSSIFHFSLPNLTQTNYLLSPGTYTLSVANDNSQAVGFTVTAYLSSGCTFSSLGNCV